MKKYSNCVHITIQCSVVNVIYIYILVINQILVFMEWRQSLFLFQIQRKDMTLTHKWVRDMIAIHVPALLQTL